MLTASRDLVYISYSHRDKDWHRRIRNFLASDPDIGERLWDDQLIRPGANWSREIAEHLDRAKAIIMITSPAYFDPKSGASRYEISPALEAWNRGEVTILWLPVKAHGYETSPVRAVMAATGPSPMPLENLAADEVDKALLRLLNALREALHLLPATTKGTGTRGVIANERVAQGPDALSLSGGGYRATFFHLGALAFHFRRRTLDNLKIITAVSGGSILAAHAVLNWETLKQNEDGFCDVMAMLVKLARSGLRDRILVPWLWSIGIGWRFVGSKATRLGKSRTGRLVRAYDTYYSQKRLTDLRRSPILALVATDLFHSSRVYFSHDGMRRFSIESNEPENPPHTEEDLPLAFAVAASSAFPPIFRALELNHRVLDLTWQEFELELRLQDGGVHDNLGLRALQLIYPEKATLGLIHSSYAVNPGNIEKPRTGLFRDRLRALEIFARGESAKIANDIATLAGATAIITKLGDRVFPNGPHLLNNASQTAVMRFRTDLDAPSIAELYALMAHGYQVTALRFNHLEHDDLEGAKAMFCQILGQGESSLKNSGIDRELPLINRTVTALSAEDLSRSGTRPKARIFLHFLVYLILVGTAVFVAGKSIWDRTHQSVPSVRTDPAVVASDAVTMHATITNSRNSVILKRRFEWAKLEKPWGSGREKFDYGVVDNDQITVSGDAFSAIMRGLQPNASYKYRAWAKTALGWGSPSKVGIKFLSGAITVPTPSAVGNENLDPSPTQGTSNPDSTISLPAAKLPVVREFPDVFLLRSRKWHERHLDIQGGNSDGDPAIAYYYTSTDNQKWMAVSTGEEGFYYLVTKDAFTRGSNQCLEIEGGSAEMGAGLVQGTAKGNAPHQQWFFEKTGSTSCVIRSRLTMNPIDLPNEALSARVVMWKYHGGDNQQWEILPTK